MSYNIYLKEYAEEIEKEVDTKVATFKEDILNSKEFINAFIDLTRDNPDEKKNELFESLMEKIDSVCKEQLQLKEG